MPGLKLLFSGKSLTPHLLYEGWCPCLRGCDGLALDTARIVGADL